MQTCRARLDLARILMTPTPLQPREFFDGDWKGEGELCYRGILGLFWRPDRFRYTNTGRWVSQTRKELEDRLEFDSGLVMRLRFTVEIIDERRLHVTSDDMPGGADILLSEHGFTYTPYVIRVRRGPFRIRLRCHDVTVVEEDGVIRDRIKMSWLGLPQGTLTMSITADRSRVQTS